MTERLPVPDRGPKQPRRAPSPRRQATGGHSRKQGRRGEWLAMIWLMLKGYQILGFRLKGRHGEIDILARRGPVLAVVEVKRRPTLVQAMEALTLDQQTRLADAAAALVRARPAFERLTPRIDMVALAPGRFPRHVRGLGFGGGGSDDTRRSHRSP